MGTHSASIARDAGFESAQGRMVALAHIREHPQGSTDRSRPRGLINFSSYRHYWEVTLDSLSTDPAGRLLQTGAVAGAEREHVRHLIDEHYAFIWRLLARLGVHADDVDDATQQVFMVLLTRERLTIQPGRERSFLFGIAVRVAREHRRRNKQRATHSAADFDAMAHPGLDLESLTDQQRARELLDRLVQSIPEELRMIFILFEVEGLPAIEVAALLDIPAGTVASRLRRARQCFRQSVQQMNIPGSLKGLR